VHQQRALDELQGPPGHPFLVRAYCAFTDAGATTRPVPAATPADFTRYLQRGRRLDLVAQFHSASGDVDGYCGFLEDLAYAGLDIFPDVFRPVPPGRLRAVTAAVLAGHRHDALAAAGLGHVPLVITEHGWPTGPGRPPARQAEVVADVVDVVAGHAGALNITGYTHHALRDASSAEPGLFSQFGILADDYAPKPAFGTYRDLVAALG
jgi:hypothetical protein